MRIVVVAAAAVVLGFGGVAPAAPLVYSNFDTRSGGSFAPVATPTNDGDGSLQLIAVSPDAPNPAGNQGKVSVVFNRSDLQPLGTLGNLSSLSFDFLKSSASTTYPTSAPAVRLQLGSGLALVWEYPYQTNGNNPVPTDAWQNDVPLSSGVFWERGNGQNFDGFPNFQPLSAWVNGYTPAGGVTLSANTPVYGIEVAFGSGINGRFEGYVDDIRAAFGNTTYSANISVSAAAVPEPASLTLFGLTGLVAVGCRVRKAARSRTAG